MTKGDRTRRTILDTAVALASRDGLEALSIGQLAESVSLSKSGLFAHFRSKEALQCQVLEHAREQFVEAVVRPALALPRGEPRLLAIFENWLAWADAPERAGGCVFLQAAADFDDRTGPVRDTLVASQADWIGALARAAGLAVAEGHFRADLDERQFAFEFHALLLAHHFHARLLGDPTTPARTRAAYQRLLQSSRRG